MRNHSVKHEIFPTKPSCPRFSVPFSTYKIDIYQPAKSKKEPVQMCSANCSFIRLSSMISHLVPVKCLKAGRVELSATRKSTVYVIWKNIVLMLKSIKIKIRRKNKVAQMTLYLQLVSTEQLLKFLNKALAPGHWSGLLCWPYIRSG